MPAGYPTQLRTLGDQIRKRRMDLGLSQRVLARRLGMSKSSIENWEGNIVEPARWMIPGITEFLGFQPSLLPATFAERLTAHRRRMGLSRERLAQILGVHKTTVVRWETGATKPPKPFREKVEAFLGARYPKPV